MVFPVLSSPGDLTASGERGEVAVGEEQGFISNITWPELPSAWISVSVHTPTHKHTYTHTVAGGAASTLQQHQHLLKDLASHSQNLMSI